MISFDDIMKNETIDGFLRVYPLLIIFYVVIAYFINNNNTNKLFFIFTLFNILSNNILKNVIFKNLMGDKNYEWIGTGKRPDGAKNCGLFKSDKMSTSYGMPSGHSQHSIAFPTFILFNSLTDNKYVIYILYLIGIGVLYSRIYYKCHTIQQVIVGGLIGFVGAVLFTKYKTSILSFVKV